MDLDRIDVAILDHLQKDGRATTLELSEVAGLSPSPCHRRQRLLEEAGIIQRYVAVLDQERVGLPVNVFVTVELAEHSDQSLQRFESAVSECPEIMECYEMTGTSDYLMRVVCADLGSYEQFIRRLLGKIGSVRAIRSAFALKRVVHRTNLPLPRPPR